MKKLYKLLFPIMLTAISAPSFAGMSVGATRVIFNEKSKEASVDIDNTQDSSIYLIRSWVSSDKAGEKVPFVITPPLFRIEPGQRNTVRINRISDNLPKDKESVYWINTLAIPPAPKTKTENTLQFSFNTRIKLFYRPAALDNKDAIENSYKQLTFNHSGSGLTAKNPTPYYINITHVNINGHELKEGYMIPPMSTTIIKDNASSGNVSWQAINDFGGLTEKANFKF